MARAKCSERKRKNSREFSLLISPELFKSRQSKTVPTKPMDYNGEIEDAELHLIHQWGRSPVDFDLREAIRRMPIWYKYAEGTAEAYISARLKANTWTAYQYAWDAIATAAASSNIKSWSQFDKEKNCVMSTLAMDGNLKAIVKNNVKATLAIVVDLITKEEEVVNALL